MRSCFLFPSGLRPCHCRRAVDMHGGALHSRGTQVPADPSDGSDAERTVFVLTVLAFVLMPSASSANERADRSCALSITQEDFRMSSDLDRIEGWFVDVLTFDLDNDGDLDAIATDTNCDGPWELHRFDSTMWSHSIPTQAHSDDPSQYLSSRLFLKSCSFFAISNQTESARLLMFGIHETDQSVDLPRSSVRAANREGNVTFPKTGLSNLHRTPSSIVKP